MERVVWSLYVVLSLALVLASLGIALMAILGLSDQLDTTSRITLIFFGSAIVMASAFAVSVGSFGRRSLLKQAHSPRLFWFTVVAISVFGASIAMAGLFPIQGLTK